MKVLMISTFGPNIRGISPYADSLANALIQQNQCDLSLCDYKNAFPKFLLPANTDYEANNDYATLDYANPRTWNVLKYKSYDVVHFQYWSPAFLPIMLAVITQIKKYHANIIITWHNPTPHEKLPLLTYFEKKLINACDGIICHTEEGKQIIKKLTRSAKIFAVHHGCELTELSTPSAADYELCQLNPDYDYVLFFGNIRPYKGLNILLDAWQKISLQFPKTKLVIAGRLWKSKEHISSKIINSFSGTEKYAKQIQHKILNSNNVVSDLDFISQEKLNSYLKIGKLAVFPYTSFESQSGAANLAATYGVPCIVTNVGGLSNLAIDKTFIAQNRTVSSLAAVLEDKLNKYSNNWPMEQHKVAKRFSWSSSAKLHINFYSQITQIHIS